MPRKLKVFRTPIGFDDAYVAAPSRKAALEAWGSEADLFARGVAEEVDDPALAATALAEPGKVIRLSRGDLAAQLEALGPRKRKAGAPKARRKEPAAKRGKVSSRPPPRRDKVDSAEAALAAAKARHDEEMDALDEEREALERRTEALRARQDKEIARLEGVRDTARANYREALEKWRR